MGGGGGGGEGGDYLGCLYCLRVHRQKNQNWGPVIGGLGIMISPNRPECSAATGSLTTSVAVLLANAQLHLSHKINTVEKGANERTIFWAFFPGRQRPCGQKALNISIIE
jgi:hypothetical protein